MKERKNNRIVNLLVVLLAFGFNVSIVGTVVAQTEIPAGATIDSAILSVYADTVNGQTVNVHQVTADWQEMVVTWGNFGGSYAPGIVNSFVADSMGWYSVDVTALVIDWVAGTYPNFGLLLEQGETPLTRYVSSDSSLTDFRPMLEISYTTADGSFSVTIQRLGDEQVDVADAYLWEPDPNWQRGDSPVLYTGLWWSGGEKQSLLRFDFTSTPPPPGGGGHTPGFWQNKHGLGLIEEYNLLGMINDLCLADDYGYIADFADTKAFKAWLKKRKATNMAYQLSGHLAAMKLNVAVGFVDGGALVYLNEDGDMISINDLMDDAAEALCEDGYTPAGDENRDDQEMLKNALDYANNNLNWVNP